MSNGGACCLLEVCCDAAKRRALLVSWFAEVIDEPQYCEAAADKLIAKMIHEDATFAPASFQAVIDDIVQIARKHKDAA